LTHREGDTIHFYAARVAGKTTIESVRTLRDFDRDIGRGRSVRTGSMAPSGRAVSVTVADGRAAGIRLADGSTIEADAVVLAVPSWNLRSLLDDVPGSEDTRLAAKQLEPIPIMNAYVLLDRPLGTAAPWESLLDSDIGWVFDRDRMHGPRADGNHLYALTTCAAYGLMGHKKAEVAERLVAALRTAYPAAREARVLDMTVVPWPKATFSSRVGMSTLRPGNRTALPNLALAGDWTHNDHARRRPECRPRRRPHR
jgi:predicted NAD/FAD-dependent oxidoreductase